MDRNDRKRCPDYVQALNPMSKTYTIIERSTGVIVESGVSKDPYPDIEIIDWRKDD